MWLTLLAVRNSVAVLMASLAIVVLGFTSLSRMPIDLFPNINLPTITIGTEYKGANVQDIEKSVTYPIEKAVSAVANVRHVESKSRQGMSAVQVWFNYDADMNAAQTEVSQRILQILNSLPSGIKTPFIIRADLSNIPVCLITVSGGGLDEKQLYDVAFNTIEPQIARLNNVAAANVDGGKIRQIAVNLNRDLLYAKGLSVLDVVRAVNDANFLMPSGDIQVGSTDYKLFTNNQFQLVKPMEDIVVRKVGEVPVHVRDLGYVIDAWEKQTSVVRVNGERAVYLRVNKQPGANTVEVVDAVRAAVPQFIGVPPGVKVDLTFDQSIYIRQSISSLWHEASQGAVLAFLVILIFLRSVISTVIIFIAIPLSILGTFIAMYFLGQTINVFTLGGLALAVGRLVDDSIVELENINRHLAIPGKERRTAVLDAAREVAMPIFVSTITTIVVFLPTVFIEGQAKLLFLPLTFTISFSLFASFLVSRTVTPLMCLRMLKPERVHDPHSRRWRDRAMAASQAAFDRMDAGYQRLLAWALGHRKLVVVGVLLVFLGSLTLYPLIGTEFFPRSDESQFRVFVRAPIGTRVEETERIVTRIEDILKTNLEPGEYSTIVSSVGIPGGRSAIFTSNTGPHAAMVQVYLATPDKRIRSDTQVVNDLRPKFAGQFPGTITFFNLGGIINRVLNRGSQNPLEVEVLGYDVAEAQAAAHQVAAAMREVPNVADVQVSREENYPQWSVVVDREKAATAGLTQRDIAQAALFSLNSNVSVNPSIFTDPRTGNQYNIVVQLDEPFRVRPEDLGKIFVTTTAAPFGNRPVLLSTIADIRRSVAPVEIERKYQQRLIRVSANPVGRDLGAVSDDIEKRLGALRLPTGFETRLGGQTAQQREAFGSLFFTTILALMLVYMVMASQFRSLKDPFIIMFSVPMGLIGVLWMLFLSGTTLSTTSFMGIIMMVGIVVSNGVLLVEYTNELRRRGMALADAVLTAGRTRLRPILMTSLTTCVGLTPMALGLLVGSEANAPLARAVIGGLIVSTGLTLLMIPTVYTMLEERFPRTLHAEDARVGWAPGRLVPPSTRGELAPMSLRPSSLFGLLLVALAAAPAAGQTPAPAPPTPAAPATPPAPAAPPAPAGLVPGQVLTLDAAILFALRQQPTIRSAEETRNAATARVPQAQSTYYPRLDFDAFLGRAQTFSTNSNTTQRSDSFNASLQARQLLYDFGKTGALVDAARADVRFSEFELERVREVVVLTVRQSYLQLVQAQRLTAVADAQVARAELNLRSARGFFDVGTKPRFDVTRAEVELANARVAQIRARNLVQFNQVSLANALGLPATTPIEVQDILVYEPIALDREALRTEALGNRPELAQAQARIEAARAQVGGARARYLPDLAATGSVGGAADEPTTNIFTQDTWSIGASLSWNLFEGFFTKYRVKETESLLAAARANYDSLELQVRLDVEQAYIAVIEAAERTSATAVAVDSARENLRLAQGRYDAGVGTILDLTDSQLALTNAEADQVRALTDHKLALAALDRSVGRP